MINSGCNYVSGLYGNHKPDLITCLDRTYRGEH